MNTVLKPLTSGLPYAQNVESDDCQGQPKGASFSAVERCTVWRRLESPAKTSEAVRGAPVAWNFAPTDENGPI